MPTRPYYVIPKGGAFSFVEKAVKGVARSVVPGFSAVEGAVKALKPKPKPKPGVSIQGPTVMTPSGYVGSLGMINLPGGLGLSLPGFGPSAEGGTCPPGYHLDKATRSKCVRNRSMNFSNGRANRRSIRRLKGAKKQALEIFKAVGGPKGKLMPRTRRKRS